MSENPYAPPSADLDAARAGSEGLGDFDFGRCFSDAWANTWANFPLWLGAGIVGLLAAAAAAATIIGIVLVVPVLMWGSFVFVLHLHDGGAKLGDLFSGFSRYGQALAGMLGWWLVSIAVGIAGQVPFTIAQSVDSAVGMIGGYAIYLAVTFLVTPRITFAGFLLVDRGLGLGEALRLAWDRTAPLMWKLAGLMLVMIAVILAGLVAFLVGVIPASVIAYLLFASAYRQIFGGPAPATA